MATDELHIALSRPSISTGTPPRFLFAFGMACFATECLYLATTPPASSFETSVYEAFPPTFWLLFTVGMAAAILGYALAAIGNTNRWRGPLLLVLCNYGVLFALPLVRGYRLYGRGTSDKLAHLGDVKTILRTGEFGGLFYPFEHLLLSELVALTDLSPETVSVLVPFFFTALYIVSLGILCRCLANNAQALTCGLCAATPLLFTFFHVEIHPAFLSFMLFPLLLLVLERYRRTNSRRSLVAFSAFTVAIIPFHPMSTVFLIVLLATTMVYGRLHERLFAVEVRKLSAKPLLTVSMIWFMWYLNFSGTQGLLRRIALTWLAGGSSVGQSELGRASSVELTFWQLVAQFVELYGAIFIYLIIAGVFSLYVLRQAVSHRRRYEELYLTYEFGIGFLIALSFLAVYLIVSNPIRLSRYMILMATVLSGLLLVRVVEVRSRRRHLVLVVLLVSIFAATMLGAGGAYRANNHMTHAEYQGAEFMLRTHDDDVPIRSYHMSDKMQQYVLGADYSEISPSLRADRPDHRLERHLGYAENETALRSFGHAYLITKEYDTEFYKASTYSEGQRRTVFVYDEADVARLSRDPTAMKLYANGGFEGWYVPGESSRG